jgi:spermidine/putrescine transport system permease protein
MAIASVSHTGSTPAVPPDPARGGSRAPYLLLLPGLAWLGVFFAIPIVFLFATSLQVKVPGGDIGEFQPALRVANYADAVGTYYVQFGRAFIYAGIATVLALLIGYPLAYMIAFKAGRYRNMLLVLVIAPFFASFLLRTVAWRQVLADEGFVVRTLKWFMTLPLYASLERIDPRLIEAGSDLYGSPFTVLRKVTFPLSLPGVVAGTLLTFIPAAGDYVNAALLGRQPGTAMVGNVIESRFFRIVDYPTAAALSFLLMAAILVLVTLYIRRAGTEELV